MAGVGELLSQATCAVLKHDGSIAGTAWLVSDQGHLLTAGHVVIPMFGASQADQQSTGSTGPVVEVRFPDADPEPCRFVQPPVHDKQHALDFALLQLEASTGRKPLPLTLMADAEGGVRASGYGIDLGESSIRASARSPGHTSGSRRRTSSTSSTSPARWTTRASVAPPSSATTQVRSSGSRSRRARAPPSPCRSRTEPVLPLTPTPPAPSVDTTRYPGPPPRHLTVESGR